MQVKRNVVNLTAWVNPDEKKLWEEDKLKTGLGWSEWIKQKVKMSMNIDQVPVYDGEDLYELRKEVRENQETIAKLTIEKHQLEKGVCAILENEDRLIRVLKSKENQSYMDILDIYMAYIEVLLSEGEENYLLPILERMTIDGKIECNRTGTGWRLKGKQWDKLRKKERQKK